MLEQKVRIMKLLENEKQIKLKKRVREVPVYSTIINYHEYVDDEKKRIEGGL